MGDGHVDQPLRSPEVRGGANSGERWRKRATFSSSSSSSLPYGDGTFKNSSGVGEKRVDQAPVSSAGQTPPALQGGREEKYDGEKPWNFDLQVGVPRGNVFMFTSMQDRFYVTNLL